MAGVHALMATREQRQEAIKGAARAVRSGAVRRAGDPPPGRLTLREAIVAAHEAGDTGERNRLLTFARERGASVYVLGPLVGVNHSTVFRWTGGRRTEVSAVLSDPVPTQYGVQRGMMVAHANEARSVVAPGPHGNKG